MAHTELCGLIEIVTWNAVHFTCEPCVKFITEISCLLNASEFISHIHNCSNLCCQDLVHHYHFKILNCPNVKKRKERIDVTQTCICYCMLVANYSLFTNRLTSALIECFPHLRAFDCTLVFTDVAWIRMQSNQQTGACDHVTLTVTHRWTPLE